MKGFLLFLLLCSVGYVHADIVWPSMSIAEGWISFPVIFSGLLIETWFVKHFEKVSWAESFAVSAVMNGVTATSGVLLMVFVGLADELILYVVFPKIGGSFHWTHWLMAYISITFTNTVVEGLVVKSLMNRPLKKTFYWLLGANAISIIICSIHTYLFVSRSVYGLDWLR